MSDCYLQKALKELRRIGPAFYCEKINDLNKELGVTFACFAHRLHQFLQSRQKSIVTNSQERSTRNVANARSFDNQSGRLSFSKSAIPIKIVLGNESVFSRAPGHHCRNPRAAFEG